MSADARAGAPLTAAQLTDIERVLDACSVEDRRTWWYGHLRDFSAALRAAWRERDDWKERFHREAAEWGSSYGDLVRDSAELQAERDRYRAALEHARDCEVLDLKEYDAKYGRDDDITIAAIVDAALAAPGAGGEQEGTT